jgi:hypothetical protein
MRHDFLVALSDGLAQRLDQRFEREVVAGFGPRPLPHQPGRGPLRARLSFFSRLRMTPTTKRPSARSTEARGLAIARVNRPAASVRSRLGRVPE